MIRGLWSADTVAWILLAAALPVAVAHGWELGVTGLGRLAVLVGLVLIWQTLFQRVFGQSPSPASLLTALAVAVVAPTAAPLWQLALAVSFGTVIGELVFGGWGRNFLNPGCVALAFLSLSMPNEAFAGNGVILAFAVLPGTLLLLLCGIASAPVLVAFTAALAAMSAALDLSAALIGAAGSLAFVATFVVADPVASPSTPAARWIYGALAGALTGLIATGASVAVAAIFAALLAAVFAPLLDQAVIALQMLRRRIRHSGI